MVSGWGNGTLSHACQWGRMHWCIWPPYYCVVVLVTEFHQGWDVWEVTGGGGMLITRGGGSCLVPGEGRGGVRPKGWRRVGMGGHG